MGTIFYANGVPYYQEAEPDNKTEKTSKHSRFDCETKKSIEALRYWNRHLESEIRKIKIWLVLQWIVFLIVVIAISVLSVC